MKTVVKSVEIGGKKLTLEVGRYAQQANGAVVASCGETMVLATVVASKYKSDLGYFPLQVEYQERLYAGGRIKGSRWVKREGRPSEEATLTARLVDRSIRPLFPDGYKNDVQVIITVLSVDGENRPDIPALAATSAALATSDIPWAGPIGSLRVGYVPKNGDGVFTANPTNQDLEFSQLDLLVSASKKALIMLEGGAKQVSEEVVLKGIEFAQKESAKLITTIESLVKEVGVKKQVFEAEKIEEKLIKVVEKEVKDKVEQLIADMATKEGSSDLLGKLVEELAEKYEAKKDTIAKIIDKLTKQKIRDNIVNKGKRPDGRKLDEIRPIEVEVGLLPRTHGSAMFKRGATQALTITTLGSPSLEQWIESMEGEETKRYIHHYNMPPFSVGETGRVGSPSRREIGHGALACRALEAVIPSEEEFPYTISVVSEIMSSNGSTSMASTCGSTLSLMDAGVPIKAPISGIAMGLVSDGKKQVVLSDIMGIEDFNGDMDFKVTGSKDGVTAIQMDVKTTELNLETVKKILAQAKVGRAFILDKMLAVLPNSREQVSKFAPKIKVVKVPVEKIGEVIGPGGKTIKKIIAETGAGVDVEDDGSVNITAPDKETLKKAVDWVESLVREVKAGESFEGVVKRIQPFGAFVEVLPGKDGLVHVSRMSENFIDNPEDVVKIGQKVKVTVTEIDDMGRINLTMVEGKGPLPKKEGFRKDFNSRDNRDNRSRNSRPFNRNNRDNRSGRGDNRFDRRSR